MRSLVVGSFARVILGVVALGSLTQAQSVERVIKANIPFEFRVANKTFPAGRYRLVETTPYLLQLRDLEGRHLAAVLTNSVERSDAASDPKLYFYAEGGQYTLAEVWQQNDSIGQQLVLPKARARLARHDSRHVRIIAAEASR